MPKTSKDKLKLRILKPSNIYYAIHSLESYLDITNLNDDLIKGFNNLIDKYDFKNINELIGKIQEKIKLVLNNEDNFFEVNVVRQLKQYNEKENKFEYRYVHRPRSIVDLIAMVSILRVFMFETDNNDIELKSTLSSTFPKNFYGSIPFDGVDMLYEPWPLKYGEFQESYIEKLLTYQKTHEFEYEINLDFKNFFPTINPFYIINHLKEIVSYIDLENVLKKLLIVKVNLNNEDKDGYYKTVDNIESNSIDGFSVGLPQGLPQSYFFANIAMTEIAPIINNEFKDSKSIYYVDDSVIFAKDFDEVEMKLKITNINEKINKVFKNNTKNKFYDDSFYEIKIHEYNEQNNTKTTLMRIKEIKTHKLNIYTLNKNASNLNWEIFTSLEEPEERAILNKTKELIKLLEDEIISLKTPSVQNENNINSYLKLLKRLNKFYKYRKYKIENNIDDKFLKEFNEEINSKLSTFENKNNSDRFIYIEDSLLETDLIFYNLIMSHTDIKELKEKLFKIDKNDNFTLQRFLKTKTIEFKKGFHILNKLFSKREVSAIEKMNLLSFKNGNYINDFYEASAIALNKISELVEEKEESKVKIYNLFKSLYNNSNKFAREITNLIYSTKFNLNYDNSFNFLKSNGSKLTYLETRIMTYIRNKNTDVNKLGEFILYVLDEYKTPINSYRVDYKIFEVLSTYIYHIRDYKLIDNLIITHHIVHSLWSSGSILFKYYTFHNEIHSIELIKIINKLIVQIDSQQLNKYEKYLLYLSAYIHDISMANMPKKSSYTSKDILLKIEHNKNENSNLSTEEKFRKVEKDALNYFNSLSNYIRNTHGSRSASKINAINEFNYLEESVKVIVSEISKAHTLSKAELLLNNYKANEIINIFKLIRLLRISDVLDIKKDRTSEVLLNNSLDFMNDYSKFEWAGHLIVDSFEIESEYSYDYKDKIIYERIIFKISLNYDNKQMVENNLDFNINYKKLKDERKGYILEYCDEGKRSKKIPYILKFFMIKNKYLFKEVKWFFNTINENNSFYKTSVKYEIIVNPKIRLNPEIDDIIRKKVLND